ncbi:MAG: uncharacterized LabA/DUF88 family protein [Candidatus Endobugula sp.]|jgi:uncharacterized LabA/DUF88 family protein
MKLAVLIDADNAQASVCSELLAEISKFGISSVKRAYGDWTTTNLKSWKSHLHKHAIQPIQQFSYTTGKNATDSSLIIDAMDLLHEGQLDGFCLVSSDSDFTRLATRIREAGLSVYGFGEKKTPEPFISACDKFIFTEILRKNKSLKKDKPEKAKESTEKKQLKETMIAAIDVTSKDDGLASLASVGSYIVKNNPSFDPRNYGFSKLGKLVRSLDYLSFQDIEQNGKSNTYISVKSV